MHAFYSFYSLFYILSFHYYYVDNPTILFLEMLALPLPVVSPAKVSTNSFVPLSLQMFVELLQL